MNCQLCEGRGQVARMRNNSRVDMVTCPSCIRGLSVLGTHELLRSDSGRTWEPGVIIPDCHLETDEPCGVWKIADGPA